MPITEPVPVPSCGYRTYMEPAQKDGVGPVRALLGGLPELLLRGVAAHRADAEETVPELLGDVGEVPGLRAHHTPVIHQPVGEHTNQMLVQVPGTSILHNP